MTVNPGSVGPGGDVDVRTQDCDRAQSGTVNSSAFVAPVRLAPASDGGMYASAVVRSGLASGSYKVSIECNGQSHDGEVEVGDGTGDGAFPSAPVPAGGGAMAAGVARHAASPAQPAGVPGTVAAGVLAVAGAAGLVMHRRRTRD